MGCQMSCYDCSSYSTNINKRIKMKRDLAHLYNDIFEREDRFLELCLKIKKLRQRQKYADDKKAHDILEEQKRADNEIRLKKTLRRRKDLLLEVIQTGIALQDRERELVAIEQKYAKIWSLAFEDDPEYKLEEWKRDLRKTSSQGNVNNAAPRRPVVYRDRYMPAFITQWRRRMLLTKSILETRE